LQTRGGHVRSEAAFGHAIALGAALAAGIPFVLMSSFRSKTKAFLLMILVGGLLTTTSRGPLLAGALGIVLVLTFASGQKLSAATRAGFAAFSAIVAIPTVYILSSRLDEAGTEINASTNYRSILYRHILQ